MKDRLQELQQTNTQMFQPPRWTSVETQWYDDLHSDGSVELLKKPPTLAVRRRLRLSYLQVVVRIKDGLKPSKSFNDTNANYMAKLLNQVEDIYQMENEIRNNTKLLKALHKQALMSPRITSDDQKNMIDLEKNTRTAVAKASSLIRVLQSVNVPDELERVRDTQLLCARITFVEATKQFENELTDYRKSLRELLLEQIVIVSGRACDDQVLDDYIEKGHTNFFGGNYQAMEQNAKESLKQISERHEELVELEKSIEEIRELFVQMSVLVAAQGWTLDNIEAHVQAAMDKTSNGRKKLKVAKKTQSSSRKKKIALAGVGTGVAALLVTVALL